MSFIFNVFGDIVKFARSCLIIGMSFYSFASFAIPSSFSYQGRILKPNGQGLEYNDVNFKFEITSSNGACVIYQEQVSGVSMVNSGGIFDISIGNNSIQYLAAGTTSILDVFKNTGTYECASCAPSGPGFSCSGSGSFYTPIAADVRRLRVSFHDGTGWKTIAPDNVIRSVPFAAQSLAAEKIGSTTEADILTRALAPTCVAANSFLQWNGTDFDCVSVSGVGSPTGAAAGDLAGTYPNPELAATGVVAGTYPKVTVDVKGRVTAGLALTAGDIPDLDASKITTGTITNNVVNTSTSSGSGSFQNLSLYDGASEYLVQVYPSGGSGYTITWPDSQGGASTFLQNDGSGNLSWVSAPASSVTSVAGRSGVVVLSNTDISGLGTSAVLNVPATGNAAAGEVVKGDDSRLTDGRAPTGAAGGDLSGTYPDPVVAQLQGQAVSATAPTLAGQALLWSGTEWHANFVRAQDLRNVWGGLTMIPSTACLANESMTWSAITDQFTCQAIGSLNASSISAGVVAPARLGTGTADSTTYLRGDGTWAGLVADPDTFLNGGNSFGGAASLGTNDNFDLSFRTNNSAKMTLTPTGFLGVNNTTPRSFIDVAVASPDTTTSPNITISTHAGTYRGAELILLHTRSALTAGFGDAGTAGWSVGTVSGNGGSGGMAGDFQLCSRNGAAGAACRMHVDFGTGNFNLGGSNASLHGGSKVNVQGNMTIGTDWASYTTTQAAPVNSLIVQGMIGAGLTDPQTAVDANGAVSVRGLASAPAVAPATQGRIYFDSVAGKFKVSESSGAYVDLVPTGGVGDILQNGNSFAGPMVIGTNNSQSLNFETNNITRMNLNSSGRLGINTTSQTTPLHVQAETSNYQAATFEGSNWGTVAVDIKASTGTGQAILGFAVSGASNYLMIHNPDGSMVFNPGANFNSLSPDAGIMTFTGFHGIRNINPSSALDLNGAMTQRGMADPGVSPAGQGRIYYDSVANKFRVSQNGGAYTDLIPAGGAGDVLQGGNSFAGPMVIGTNDANELNLETSGTTRLTVNSTGNIGIGITNPTEQFHVVAPPVQSTVARFDGLCSGCDVGLSIRNDVNQPHSISMVSFDSRWSGGATTYARVGAAQSATSQSDGYLKFVLLDDWGLQERMRLTAEGHLGIRTTAPRAALDVNGAIVTKAATVNTTATVDFGTGNLQYTDNNCGAFQLDNMKDGGSYSFAVKGTAVATCSFTAFSGVGTGSLTVKMPPDHGATTTGKHTLYNFMVMGTDVYVAWTPGY